MKQSIHCITKKLLGAVLGIALFVLVYGNTAFAYTNTWGVVKSGGANIRSQATTSSDIVASVAADSRVEICGQVAAEDGYTWYKVHVSGTKTGYIRGDLVNDTGEATGSVSEDTEGTVADTQETVEEEQTEVVEEVDTSLSDATIHTLSISEGTLNPTFDPSITSYTINVGEDTSAISVFGVPNTEAGASIIENTGFAELELGSNPGIITVQAADGTTLSYTFTVVRGTVVEEVSEGDGEGEGGAVTYTVKTGNSHTGLIIFLVILVVVLGAACVFLLLNYLDLRKQLDGSAGGFVGRRGFRFSLPDFKAMFAKKDGPNKTVYKKNPVSLKSLSKKERIYEEDEEYAPNEDFGDEEMDNVSYANPQSSLRDEGMRYASVEDALNSIKNVTNPAYHPADMVRQPEEEDTAIEPEEGYDLDDEDEIEDILERNATITDNNGSSKVWKPENFLTPRDDLEFEFLDIDDEDK